MDDWALSDDDRPTPRWLMMGIVAAVALAVVSMILMGLWLVALYLVPGSVWP
jgi:hypothetical protein